MRTHFVFSLIYAIYIDVWRSRGSNQAGKLFKYTHKYIIIALEQSPMDWAKKRICFWYVFTSPSSRRGLQGVFGHKWIKKSVYYVLIHVHSLYYYFYTRYMRL